MDKRRTAAYKIIKDSGGNRYRFFCDVSVAAAYTTQPVKGADPQAELELAWTTEGEACFNRCHRCGRWVIDAMYNADVLECVLCAPWESEPAYCKTCGARVSAPGRTCPVCGEPLVYEGRPDMM